MTVSNRFWSGSDWPETGGNGRPGQLPAPGAFRGRGGPAPPSCPIRPATRPTAGAGFAEEVQGLRRLIESGTGAFNLDDIGTGSILDYEALRAALDGLDGTPGNVTFTDTLTGDPINGEVRFDTQIVKRLDGTADFDVAFDLFGGSVDLNGLDSDRGLEVVVDLTFGIDAERLFHRCVRQRRGTARP